MFCKKTTKEQCKINKESQEKERRHSADLAVESLQQISVYKGPNEHVITYYGASRHSTTSSNPSVRSCDCRSFVPPPALLVYLALFLYITNLNLLARLGKECALHYRFCRA